MEKREFDIIVYKAEKELEKRKGQLFNRLSLYHFMPFSIETLPSDMKRDFLSYREAYYDLLESMAAENNIAYQRPSTDLDKQLDDLDSKAKKEAEKMFSILEKRY